MTDAKATETGTWMVGWKCKGGIKASEVRWFAFEIEEDVFPTCFVKEDPKRVLQRGSF